MCGVCKGEWRVQDKSKVVRVWSGEGGGSGGAEDKTVGKGLTTDYMY